MGGSNDELQDLTNKLVDRATAYEMEVSIEKSKIMNNINADISMNSQRLEEVTCARMAPAQQKSASKLPQQGQQWPD